MLIKFEQARHWHKGKVKRWIKFFTYVMEKLKTAKRPDVIKTKQIAGINADIQAI